jgi:hypothetical protein
VEFKGYFLYRTDQGTHKAADAAMAGQRAFIAPDPYQTPDTKFGVIWSNVGHLPPANLRNHIHYWIGSGDLPSDFRFPDDAEPIVRGTLLVPGQKVFGPHVPTEGAFTEAQVASIRRDEKKLYIFGWAKYRDGFPHSPERVNNFCYRVRPTDNPGHPFVFDSHYRHNCADDDCNENQ